MCEEYNKMAGFVRATRGKQFNESTERLVAEGINHYAKLRESLGKIRGKKGYNNYFESWTPPLMEDEEQTDLSEMFMSSSLDPRIESVMPILGKLSKNLGESKPMAEVIALQNWADETTDSSGDIEDYQDPEEADYGDEYQKSAKNAGEAVKRIEQKMGKVDMAKLAKKLNREETSEGLDADQKAAGQLGPVGGPAKKGDLVGACESTDTDLARMRLLSGL